MSFPVILQQYQCLVWDIKSITFTRTPFIHIPEDTLIEFQPMTQVVFFYRSHSGSFQTDCYICMFSGSSSLPLIFIPRQDVRQLAVPRISIQTFTWKSDTDNPSGFWHSNSLQCKVRHHSCFLHVYYKLI